MSLRQFEIFHAVMITGSTSAAASLLAISQPAVSRAITRLETDAGFVLFDRTSGRMIPTAEAGMLFNEVKDTFAGVERVWKLVSRIKNAKAGQLQIAVLPAIGTSFLPSVVAEFGIAHPGLDISLNIESSAGIEELVRNQQIDFGITEKRPVPLGVEVEDFCRAPMLFIAPHGHELASRACVSPSDIAPYNMVSLFDDQLSRRLLETAFEAAGCRLKTIMTTQTNSVICEFVLNEVGVAVVDPFTAIHYRDRGLSLIALQPEIPFSAHILYPKHRPLTQSARAMLRTLRQRRNLFMAHMREMGWAA